MGGLAAAILFVMALMLAGLALAFGAGGWLAAKRLGWQGARRTTLITGSALVGVAGGWLWANATFYESQFDPPPELTVRVTPGFAASWAVLLEDPAKGVHLVWRGGDWPFQASKAEILLPKNSVLRVRDFGQMRGRGDMTVRWSDGAVSTGSGGGPAPEGLGASGYIVLSHERAGATGPGAMLPQGAALAAYVRDHEGR